LRVYVIDASVASRFLLVEDLSDKAELLLKGFLNETLDLKAPQLIIYEVGNTLWKAVERGLIDYEEAERRFTYFLDLKLDSIELSSQDYREVLEWSVRNNATYYDSVYVISSKKVGATLLTADNTLHKKALRDVPTLHLRDY